MHFRLGQRLDRVFNKNQTEIRHAKGIGLGPTGIGEFRGGKGGNRNAGFFKKDAVVHTARGAGASIGQGFNDNVALLRRRRVPRRLPGAWRI